MKGLAIEAATAHVEVAVVDASGARAHVAEDVGHGHTRRLTPLVESALAAAGVAARDLEWIAADLGPGSFTGVRVGLATASAYALVSGARRLGASSLAALAHASPARRALVVPLVEAGRLDVYAGFYRVGPRGALRLVQAPRVLRAGALAEAVAEAHALVPGAAVRFVGPGAGRERERLEAAYPSSTAHAFRHDGLSALDLAAAAQLRFGPGAGLPAEGGERSPVYVRPAQAEERVRHAANAAVPLEVRDMTDADVREVVETEQRVFPDPWSARYFRELVADREVLARVAVRDGVLAGYAVTSVRSEVADLEDIATVPGQRRAGVARALVADLLERAASRGATTVQLEVRVSNDAAQALYRAFGFRATGLRPGYYTRPAEDALLMTWVRG